MACSALVVLAAGACCVALHYRRRPTESTRARRAALAVLMLAALAVHADVLLSIAHSTVAANRAVVSYVEESTNLMRMLVEAKLDPGDLAGVLSKNPAEAMDPTSHDTMNNHGGEERINTGDFLQPPKVEGLMDNATVEQEIPTSEETAPPPASADEAHARPPAAWRSFSFPSNHVLLLGCSGDEFTVRIMPRQEAFEQQKLRHANCDLPDGCLRPAAGTLYEYNRHPYYYAVFWSLPGMEKFVPVPLAAKESEVALVMEEAPEAFVLSTDVVAFYLPNSGRSEIHIRPHNAVGFIPVSTLEEEGQALQAIYPLAIIHTED